MMALVYVSYYGVTDGSDAARMPVLAILSVSIVLSVICGIAQPISFPALDEARVLRLARWNLGFAMVDTVIVLILSHPSACDQCVTFRQFPVGWLALAGMHYGWTIWLYIIRIRQTC